MAIMKFHRCQQLIEQDLFKLLPLPAIAIYLTLIIVAIYDRGLQRLDRFGTTALPISGAIASVPATTGTRVLRFTLDG